MKLVRPLRLFERWQQASNYVESNLSSAFPLINKGTSWIAGQRGVGYDGYIYLCTADVTIYDARSPTVPPAANFVKEGPDNAALMWDDEISTQSTSITGNITITMNLVEPIDTVALLNVTGEVVSIEIREYDGGPILYTDTSSLSGDTSLNWYQYFFFTYGDKKTQAIWRDLPPYANSFITLTVTAPITPPIPSVGVGFVVAGQTVDLGLTQYGLQAGILDYSKKETDPTYGTTTFLKRAFSKRMSATLFIDTFQVNRAYRILSDTRAYPSLWIASEDPYYEEPGVVFGFFREFNMEFSMPTYTVCTLEIEGLT